MANRLILLLVIAVLLSVGFSAKSSQKPKKYKCVLVEDNEEVVQPVASSYVAELAQRRIQATAESESPPETMEYQRPSPIRKVTLGRLSTVTTTVAPITNPTLNPPITPNMRLPAEYCSMIKNYATMYSVRDVPGWVHKNCAFAKMYLPNATCQEIDVLVASCYA